MDIEYTIEKCIDVINEFNTYNVGYKIKTDDKINYNDISSVIRYFEKYYKIEQDFNSIKITEEQIKQVENLVRIYLIEWIKKVIFGTLVINGYLNMNKKIKECGVNITDGGYFL
jgi:DNA-directed RNA polymerase alpha subunit